MEDLRFLYKAQIYDEVSGDNLIEISSYTEDGLEEEMGKSKWTGAIKRALEQEEKERVEAEEEEKDLDLETEPKMYVGSQKELEVEDEKYGSHLNPEDDVFSHEGDEAEAE